MSEQQILQASLKLFARFGYDYVSVRQIAGEANVNIGSISYYFQNKIGILQRIVDDFYKGLGFVLQPVLENDKVEKKTGIESLTRVVMDYMYTNLEASKIVVREITLEMERFEEIVKQHHKEFNDKYIDFFMRIGLQNPKVATIKFMALTRFPIANSNMIEYYYDQPYSPKIFKEYANVVLSSFSDELSV